MNKLIYFVDDDKMILNLLEYTLNNRNNYLVKTFNRGEDLLDSLSIVPDLVVLDHSYVLQVSQFKNGLELLKKIRERNIQIPVIVLSAEQNFEIINEYLNTGVTKFIVKDSYFIDSLIESINEVLSN